MREFQAIADRLKLWKSQARQGPDGMYLSWIVTKLLHRLGQGEQEFEPSFRAVADRDFAFMELDGVFHDGEAKPGASLGTGPAFIDPVEPFKNTGQVFFRNAFAIVRIAEIVEFFVFEVLADLDSRSFPGIVDRVFHQVLEDRKQQAVVPVNGDRFRY